MTWRVGALRVACADRAGECHRGVGDEELANDRCVERGPLQLMKVDDRLRGQRAAALGAVNGEVAVQGGELICVQMSELHVSEMGEQVVLDGREVAGVGGRGERGLPRRQPLAQEIVGECHGRSQATTTGALVAELARKRRGFGAGCPAMPAPPLLAGDGVHSFVDHGVVGAGLLDDVGHLLVLLPRIHCCADR